MHAVPPAAQNMLGGHASRLPQDAPVALRTVAQ